MTAHGTDRWVPGVPAARTSRACDARGELSGWTIIPAVLMVAVILLTLLGVRPRLAEYR